MAKMFQVYGLGQALIPVLPPPIPFLNAPTSNQTNYEIGQVVYTPPTAPTTFYIYAGGGNWEVLSASGGNIAQVLGTANQVAVSTVAGVATVSLIGPYTPATYTAHGVLIGEGTSSIVATSAGTAGQVLVSGGASADPTWSTATFPTTAGATGTILRSNGTNWVATTDTWPNTVVAGDILIATAANVVGSLADVATGQVLMSGGVGVAPAYSGSPSVSGSLTAATTVTATLGAITATNGNLVMGTAGNKIIVPTGSNASAGTSGVMSGTPGAVTVATTASSTTALIFFSRKTTGGTPGQVSITAQDGTGFTLTSTGNETSTFNWWIINA
jgi:hypothetical protein